MNDYYKVLGVDRIASRDEVHKAFLRLAARYQANRKSETGAAARLVAITQAHDVLFDPVRRSAYDFEVWRMPS